MILSFPQTLHSSPIDTRLDELEAQDNDSRAPGLTFARSLAPLSKNELMAALRHKNIDMRRAAIYILQSKHLGEMTVSDFRDVEPILYDESQPICRDAASLLASNLKLGKKYLIKALRSGQSLPSVCAAAALLKDPDAGGVKKEAVSNLMQCLVTCSGQAENLSLNYLMNNVHPELIPEIEKLVLDTSATPQARHNAANVWSWRVGKEDRQFSRKMLRSDDAIVRRAGAQILADGLIDTDTVHELMGLIHDPDPQVRGWVFHAIEDANNPEALPALIEGLGDSNGDAFSHAAWGIEKLHATSALPILVKILADGEKSHKDVSGREMTAGGTISKLTGTNFTFGPFGMSGNTWDGAYDKIRQGKKLGGAEGNALIEQGEREKKEIDDEIASAKTRNEQHNEDERKRLLKWWKAEGRAKFKG
jgi:HEAT repeat protein